MSDRPHFGLTGAELATTFSKSLQSRLENIDTSLGFSKQSDLSKVELSDIVGGVLEIQQSFMQLVSKLLSATALAVVDTVEANNHRASEQIVEYIDQRYGHGG